MTTKEDLMAKTLGNQSFFNETIEVAVPDFDPETKERLPEDVIFHLKKPTIKIRDRIHKSKKSLDENGNLCPHREAVLAMINMVVVQDDNGEWKPLWNEASHYDKFLERDETEEWFAVLTKACFEVLYPKKKEEKK